MPADTLGNLVYLPLFNPKFTSDARSSLSGFHKAPMHTWDLHLLSMVLVPGMEGRKGDWD